jgi:CheY-like chemotaxis protein
VRAKILAVEDNPLNLMLVCDLLELEGYTMITASTGEEALGLARTEQPDLILMDIQIPGMDGLEVTRRLKAATTMIPVVALTAYAMEGDAEKFLAAGCAGYIAKPIDTRAFPGQIAGFLKGA